MRILILKVLTVFLALPVMAVNANASSKVTVAQLEQTLAAIHGTPDAIVAEQLSGFELTERLSAARLARLKAELPGEKAQQALAVLAHSSEFLNLPAEDIPSTAAPDVAEQRRTMALVVGYTTKAVRQLPNFFATRAPSRRLLIRSGRTIVLVLGNEHRAAGGVHARAGFAVGYNLRSDEGFYRRHQQPVAGLHRAIIDARVHLVNNLV